MCFKKSTGKLTRNKYLLRWGQGKVWTQKDETVIWDHISPRDICQFQRGGWEIEYL